MRTCAFLGWVFVFVALAPACGGARPSSVSSAREARAADAIPAANDCRRAKAGGAKRMSGAANPGGSVALASAHGRTIAYVADLDAKAVRTIDVDDARLVAKTEVKGAPSAVLVLVDGRVAVALRDANAIEVLEPSDSADEPLAARCLVDVPSEPVALAATPDERALLVSSAWGHAFTALDATTLARRFSVSLPREPRAIVVDDSGERAFVSHVVNGVMSVVDLASPKHEARAIDLRVRKVEPPGPRFSTAPDDKLRQGSQGFAIAKTVSVAKDKPSDARTELVFAPMVSVEPGDPSVQSPAYYGDTFDGVAKEAPVVAVVDASAERTITKNVVGFGSRLARECVLPRAAAVRAKTGELLVACQGIDALLALDTRGVDPARLERRRFKVASGPTGFAIDEEHGRAIVWSQFEPAVNVVELDAKSDAVVRTARFAPSVEPAFAAGRVLFHLTDDRRISNDGSACASCHPDGRDDALTWATPEGPRQTIMLAGRVRGTGPYGWAGHEDGLRQYLAVTFERLGGNLQATSEAEIDALLAYLEKMPAPRRASRGDEAAIARGKAVFDSPEQGCAGCHLGGTTDRRRHDVGTSASADAESEFDTPSLRFVSGTAPYFHDGRYSTLDALLGAEADGMGHTSQLSRADREALRMYLETL